MSAPQTLNLTKSLANDHPRASLEPWLEDIETHARNLCAQHDVTVTGALTLVAADDVWNCDSRDTCVTVLLGLGS